MARVKGGQSWESRHKNDPYVKAAQSAGYRARSAFKLLEIHQSQKIFKRGQKVLDLGAAPGSWSQVAKECGANVVAMDILPMEPIPGVTFIQGDFLEPLVQQHIIGAMQGELADVIISDMAPNMSGTLHRDMARSLELCQTVLILCDVLLKPRGNLLMKIFEGSGIEKLHVELRKAFQSVRSIKPKASRSTSREYYIWATGFNNKP